jgi:hypothetical protein
MYGTLPLSFFGCVLAAAQPLLTNMKRLTAREVAERHAGGTMPRRYQYVEVVRVLAEAEQSFSLAARTVCVERNKPVVTCPVCQAVVRPRQKTHFWEDKGDSAHVSEFIRSRALATMQVSHTQTLQCTPQISQNPTDRARYRVSTG